MPGKNTVPPWASDIIWIPGAWIWRTHLHRPRLQILSCCRSNNGRMQRQIQAVLWNTNIMKHPPMSVALTKTFWYILRLTLQIGLKRFHPRTRIYFDQGHAISIPRKPASSPGQPASLPPRPRSSQQAWHIVWYCLCKGVYACSQIPQLLSRSRPWSHPSGSLHQRCNLAPQFRGRILSGAHS